MKTSVKTGTSISIYCKCELCNEYFETTGRKRSRFCGRSCREKVYYASSNPVKTRKRKLSDEDRVMVVEDYKRGVSSRELSRHYGISYSMVLRYVRKSGVEYRAVSGRKKAPTI